MPRRNFSTGTFFKVRHGANRACLKGDSTGESHAREFLAKPFCFGRMFRFLETVSEVKKRWLPLFIRGDRIRQEIDDGTIPAARKGVLKVQLRPPADE